MDDPSAQAKAYVEKLRSAIIAIRRSPREITTATIAILCFTTATVVLGNDVVKSILPPQYLEVLRYILRGIGALLFVWTFYQIWKQAIPAALPEPQLGPSAIKGTMSFTQDDAELFRGLERKAELEKIRDCVLNDQNPLVIVMGESGVGKSSLLRAGLSDILDKKKIRVVYWESLPNDPINRLLHAAQASWETSKDGELPKSLPEIIKAFSEGQNRTVFILDQFEQLSFESEVHGPVFEVLKQYITSAMSPYRLTWVIAYRRDYDPSWRDFELTIPGFHPLIVSLKRFTVDQAQRCMATLANAAGFTLDDGLVADLSSAASDDDGRVSPVEIGIGMLILASLASRKNSQHLGKEDYKFAGGAEGVLTAYVSDRLERFGDGERQEVLKALLALSDLQNNRRIAEGKSLDDLTSHAQLPPARLGSSLEYLALPQVRILERMSATTDRMSKYRFTHDRLVGAVRLLTGQILASADQAHLILENAFRMWMNSRNERFLLSGSDLRTVIEYRDKLSAKNLLDERDSFLRLSIRRRFKNRLITGGIAFLAFTVALFAWLKFQAWQAKRDLLDAGAPGNLYEYQNQLTDLTLGYPIANLGWLGANHLEVLSVSSDALRTVNVATSNVRTLVLTRTKLSSLEGVNKLFHVTTLTLSDDQLTSVAGLGKSPSITTLNLTDNGLESLAGFDNLKLPRFDGHGNSNEKRESRWK
jgi:hypothetical protein